MKKILLLVILFFCVSFIIYINYNKKSNEDIDSKNVAIEQTEVRGIFISYIDYSAFLKGKTAEEQKKNINEMILNIKNSDFNMIILQVRPFSDAIYNSKIYLSSKTVVEKEGDELELDILEYFINEAHDNNIKIHAWVNPYRIRSTSSTDDISENNFYYNWINTNKIEISSEGIYFNPADEEVLNYIVKGIEELALNYDIDGILYDDYFYPTKSIDLSNYEEYQKNGGDLTIEKYRISNINNLLYKTYTVIKKIDKNILFGISPAGNINNNLNEEYLDIENILKNNDIIDYVMPQIYYGFENESMPFIESVKQWNNLINGDIKLYIALALYKSGTEDVYAGSGRTEWINNDDIIKKQIIIGRNYDNYSGFSIFRYNYLFYDYIENNALINEIKNMKSIF